LLESPAAAQPLDRPAAAALVAGMAALCRRAVGAFGGLRIVGARRDVPLADPTALRARQPVRRHQGPWCIEVRAAGGHPGLYRKRVVDGPDCGRGPGVVVWLGAGGGAA